MVERRLEEDMAQHVGLSHYEHAADRHNYRNGHYVEYLLTEMGEIELLVLRSRNGKFPSRLFARFAWRCPSVDQVLLGCFCLGLSMRKDPSVLAPLLGERVSAAMISLIAEELDHEVKRYHSRALTDRYRYLLFDGVVLKSNGAVKVQVYFLLCAFEITVQDTHEMIDFYAAASESQACWESFFNLYGNYSPPLGA